MFSRSNPPRATRLKYQSRVNRAQNGPGKCRVDEEKLLAIIKRQRAKIRTSDVKTAYFKVNMTVRLLPRLDTEDGL